MTAEDPDLVALRKNVHPIDVIGLVTGLVPFFVSHSETKSSSATSTADGGLLLESTTTKHVDYVALAGGGVTVLLAVVGLFMIGRMRTRALRFVVFAALLALGSFQIIRGALVESGGGSSGTMLR